MGRMISVYLVVLVFPTLARAEFISSYGVFGAEGMTINGATVENGETGSNGSIMAGSFTQLLGGVAGGGTLTFNGTAISGPVTFNGDVTGNTFGLSGTITGPINTGGNANLAATVTGSLTAAQNVNLQFTTFNGPILAGGNVSVAGLCTVNGPITANGTISNGGTINGTSSPNANTTVTPTPYTPVSLPAATSFTSGGQNISVGFAQSQTLTPGSYGALSFNGTVTLTAGTYYFSSIQTSGSFGTLNFDLTNSGNINVYVTGNISLNQSLFENVVINGVSQAASFQYASQIYFESGGNIELGGFNLSNTLLGTYYAPNGNLVTDTFTNLYGNLYAGGTMTLGDGVIQSTVPEPASTTLLGLALVTGAAVRFRQVRFGRRALPESAETI